MSIVYDKIKDTYLWQCNTLDYAIYAKISK